VLLRSNRWPGSYIYAAEGGKKCASIYVGWGQKFTGKPYNPQLPAVVAPDTVPSAVTEVTDPSVEDEAYFDKLDAEVCCSISMLEG